MVKFDAGVGRGELPADLALVVVGCGLPGGEFGVEDVEVVDPAGQALAGQGGQLDLGDVEPGAVLGCVVDLEPLGQRACFGWLERFVERTEGVRVEVVHDQDDPLRVGVVDVEKLIDFRGPVDPGPLRPGVDPAAAGEGLDPHEDRAGAVPDVLGVFFEVVARAGRDRIAGVAEELVWLFVHTDNRIHQIIWKCSSSKRSVHWE